MMEQHLLIFKKETRQEYVNLFQQYYISTVYGDQLTMGSDLINDSENN